MRIQIIVDKNLVIMDHTSVNIDCTKFKEQFVFCEVNEKEKWIEKEPFNGKEQPKQWKEIEEFIDIAKSKSNQPNSYSVWNEDSKSWIEDMELKEIQEQVQFRATRNQLLVEADIEINKREDLGQDSNACRIYRQALRDATITWVMPEKPL